jgi:hypothetical protein
LVDLLSLEDQRVEREVVERAGVVEGRHGVVEGDRG